jgi:amino acid transporter
MLKGFVGATLAFEENISLDLIVTELNLEGGAHPTATAGQGFRPFAKVSFSYVLTMSVYAFAFGHYVAFAFGAGPWIKRGLAIGIMAVLVGLNLLGTGKISSVERVIVAGNLIILIGLGVAWPNGTPCGWWQGVLVMTLAAGCATAI